MSTVRASADQAKDSSADLAERMRAIEDRLEQMSQEIVTRSIRIVDEDGETWVTAKVEFDMGEVRCTVPGTATAVTLRASRISDRAAGASVLLDNQGPAADLSTTGEENRRAAALNIYNRQ